MGGFFFRFRQFKYKNKFQILKYHSEMASMVIEIDTGAVFFYNFH